MSKKPSFTGLALQGTGTTMQIFVSLSRDSYRGTIALHVDPFQTLGHLKSELVPREAATGDFYLSFDGRALEDRRRFVDYGIQACDILHARVRAYGGGGDGGATGAESRDCYLNMYAVKKPDKADPNETRLAKWSRCRLSSEALTPPCAIDLLGNLFNKEALVSALLAKTLPKELCHIRGLKDIVSVHLSLVPGIRQDDDVSEMKFQCPISDLELNGKYKFFALRGCGHVLSARALREVQTSTCLVCQKEFADADKIVINGNEEEVLALRKRLEEEKVSAKDRKDKKLRKGCPENAMAYVEAVRVEKLEQISENGIKRKDDGGLQVKDPKDDATFLDKSVLHTSKKYKAVDHMPPNATRDVYASIFTSSNKADLKETFTCRSLPIGRN